MSKKLKSLMDTVIHY